LRDHFAPADRFSATANRNLDAIKNHRARANAMQFTPLGVERVMLEEIAQVGIPSRGHL
jgi:hypothetical protein